MVARTRLNIRLYVYCLSCVFLSLTSSRLEWIGHVEGMNQGRRVKKIYESKG